MNWCISSYLPAYNSYVELFRRSRFEAAKLEVEPGALECGVAEPDLLGVVALAISL